MLTQKYQDFPERKRENYSSWSEERTAEDLKYQAGYNKEVRTAVKRMKRAGATESQVKTVSSSRSSDALPDAW
jgi:hypothetical protein